MGRVRVVSPGSDRVEISDGDWIEVKRELNTGDSKRLEGAGLKPPVMVEGRVISPIDWTVYELERALIFLTDWSLKGADDKPLPLNLDSLKAIDPPSFDEINNAIVKHTVDKAKEKNAQRALTTENSNQTSDASGSSPTLL